MSQRVREQLADKSHYTTYWLERKEQLRHTKTLEFDATSKVWLNWFIRDQSCVSERVGE